MFGFGRKKKEEPKQCFGLLETGTQTIPCPRILPCVHHPEGKGTFDLASQRSSNDDEEIRDVGELSDSEKLDGIMGLLEELNDNIRPITDALGFGQHELDDEEEADGEDEPDEEPEEEKDGVLSLDDVPSEDELS